MPFVQLLVADVGVSTYQDATRGLYYKSRNAIHIGEAIHDVYKKGIVTLLTGYGQGQRIMISSGLPLKTFRLIYRPGEKRLMKLESLDDYLVLGKDRFPESQEIADYWLARKELLISDFVIRRENDHYIFLERKPQTHVSDGARLAE